MQFTQRRLRDLLAGEPALRLPLPAAYADPAFLRCADEAIGTPELVENFNRLYGASLGARRSPLDAMVDKATGKQADDMRAFTRFIHDGIYLRLPDEAIHAFRAAAFLESHGEQVCPLSDHGDRRNNGGIRYA